MTDSELEYALSDILAAIGAYPESANVARYLADRDAIKTEQWDRERKRGNRRRDTIIDPLAEKARRSIDDMADRAWVTFARRVAERSNTPYAKREQEMFFWARRFNFA